ncbi:jg12548 [Pararge aegeria aegeria]|uniref:Jg12548 protein n=1 Tax=Pararge aegeria aegeria TaxID=348720 RepID=A0A8S4SI52_9NEOP|nr:jg12548 [Pararge aegeria aegeria]
MFLSKVTFGLLLAVVVVAAEKKIELQDIEEDNLRNEKQKHFEKSDGRGPSAGTAPGSAPMDFLKNGLLHYFEGPTQQPQQSRYIQQYDVTEQPERSSILAPKPQYGPPQQQAMLGYLSNVPMQIYLIPQYYNEPTEQVAHQQNEVQITAPAAARTQVYQDEQQNQQQEQQQQQTNYIEVPTYVTPTGKPYTQPYTSPLIYVSHGQPSIASVQPTATPVFTYQVPVVQYSTAISAPPPKGYYQSPQYTETNSVDEVQENNYNFNNQYSSHTEIPSKPSGPDYPRYYNSRAPLREEYRTPLELPHPSSLLIKAPPPHLSHIPKALPEYRPIAKPVYASGGNFISSAYSPRPSESYNTFKRRPTSLLDSYIPSSVQIEYLKRGYTKDPLAAYEALSSGRFLSQTPVIPRHYERGFLPNEIYHTAAGGITFGHHKRAPKINKPQKK